MMAPTSDFLVRKRIRPAALAGRMLDQLCPIRLRSNRGGEFTITLARPCGRSSVDANAARAPASGACTLCEAFLPRSRNTAALFASSAKAGAVKTAKTEITAASATTIALVDITLSLLFVILLQAGTLGSPA